MFGKWLFYVIGDISDRGGKSYIIGVGFLSEFLWWEAHSYGRIAMASRSEGMAPNEVRDTAAKRRRG